jgi:hypothetical protein
VNPLEIRYAWNGHVGLAYRMFGGANGELVLMGGSASHVRTGLGGHVPERVPQATGRGS